MEQLSELCQSYAERYEEFGGNWMAMPTIAKAVPGLDAESCEISPRRSIFAIVEFILAASTASTWP